jgi:hypothetical protein
MFKLKKQTVSVWKDMCSKTKKKQQAKSVCLCLSEKTGVLKQANLVWKDRCPKTKQKQKQANSVCLKRQKCLKRRVLKQKQTLSVWKDRWINSNIHQYVFDYKTNISMKFIFNLIILVISQLAIIQCYLNQSHFQWCLIWIRNSNLQWLQHEPVFSYRVITAFIERETLLVLRNNVWKLLVTSR